MRKFIKPFILLAVIFILLYCAAMAQDNVFPFKYQQTVLDNGLKIITIPYDSPGVVAYYTVVRAGSRNEVEPGHSGFAHLFEHMMFRGTEKYPAQKYNQILKTFGIDDNAFTSDDLTCYHLTGNKNALEKIIELESDRFMNLHYSEEEFKTEAGAVLGEYNKNFSNPRSKLREKLRDLAFDDHTYKHTTMGFLEDIKKMPGYYDYSIEFFNRYYRPENCVIVVVGDFDRQKTVGLIKKYYSPWKFGGRQFKEIPKEPPQVKEKTADIKWKNATLPIILMGYHVPAFSDVNIDIPTLDVLSELLFSTTSDLYKELVLDKQWVESISGGYTYRRDPYLFTIEAKVKDAKNADAVRDKIYEAIEKIKNTPPQSSRIKEIVSHLKYLMAMDLDTPDNVNLNAAYYLSLTEDLDSINRYYALLDKIKPATVQEVARKYFLPDNRTIVTLSYGGGK